MRCPQYNSSDEEPDYYEFCGYDIFKYGTTSKFDSNGNQIGTGLGMYIVASIVNEYHGTYALTKVDNGFGIQIVISLN